MHMMHPGLWLALWISIGLAIFVLGVIVSHWIPNTRVRDGVRTFLFAAIFTFGLYGEGGTCCVPMPSWSAFVYLPAEAWIIPSAAIIVVWLILFGASTAVRKRLHLARRKKVN
jgi:hypothetical protein